MKLRIKKLSVDSLLKKYAIITQTVQNCHLDIVRQDMRIYEIYDKLRPYMDKEAQRRKGVSDGTSCK